MVLSAVRMIKLRRQADQWAAQGRADAAYEAYAEVAAYQSARDPVLGAGSWERAARQAMLREDRPAQVTAAGKALALLAGRDLRRSPLGRETVLSALVLTADGLQWLGRLGEAEAVARRAVEATERFGTTDDQLGAYAALAQVLLRRGRPAETLACQHRVVELARHTGRPALIAGALTDLGAAWLNLHQPGRALAATDEALAVVAGLDDPQWTGKLRLGTLAIRASIWRSTGEHAKAIEAAETAMDLCERHGRREQFLQARMAWALAQLESGHPELSAATVTEIFDEVLARGGVQLARRAAISLATATARAGDLAEARRWAERAVELEAGGDRDGGGTARFNLACVAMLQGELATAETLLLAAVEDWEAVRADVTDDRLHVDVLEAQARAYRALQACRLATGDPGGALAASERARGRSLLRGLGAPVPDEDFVALAAAHDTALLVYSLVPPVGDARLDPVAVAGLHVWHIDAGGITHAAIGVEAIRALAGLSGAAAEPDPFLGRDLSIGAAHLGPALDDAAVTVLSRLLVAPCEPALAASRARRLVVVPDGELDQLPFAALRFTDGARFADRWPVSVVPAIAVFAELARRDDTAPGPVLVVGDPLAPDRPLAPGLPVPQLPPLPHAAREARVVAAGHGAAPLVGAAATRTAVLAALPHCGLAHFATHGTQGAEDGTTPGVLCLSPSGADDGYLRADAVAALRLPECRIAILSACRTGGGRSTYEGTLGLARAFLAAGVRAVVVSLWPVHDAATADLMITLHEHLRTGTPVADALRHAMLHARDAGATLTDWAAFTVVGDPATALPV